MTLLADWQLQGPLLALWPYRNDVWRGNACYAQQAMLQMLTRIAPYHSVRLGIHPPQLQQALQQLPEALEWFPLSYDDSWIRDYGPQFVAAEQLYAWGADFDGWQGVHSAHRRDQRVAQRLSQRTRRPFRKLPFIFEGGMLSHDGAGTAFVHAASLQRRNPQWGRSQLERVLRARLGLTRIIWIETALCADETLGHVDNQIQFIGPDLIAYAQSENDPKWNQEVLSLRQQAWSAQYRWLELPPCQAVIDKPELFHDVQRKKGVRVRGQAPILASYVNMIRLPNTIVVPQFLHERFADSNRLALAQVGEVLSDVKVIAVDATEFIRGGGGPHCLSLILPNEVKDHRDSRFDALLPG